MSEDFDPSGEIPKSRKTEGIELVSNNNREWMETGLWLADTYLPHGEVMGEDFQKLPGIGKPTSEHAWGALVQAAKRCLIIRTTGEFRKSTRITNNAHPYPVYWRDGYPKGRPDAEPDNRRGPRIGGVATPPQRPPEQLPLFRFYNEEP